MAGADPASAQLPPTITKTFGAPSIPLSATTSLTFTIANPNGATVNTGVGFSDTFPVGLAVATPNGLTSSCGGGATVTATSGSSNVSLSSAAIGANGSCTVSVNVTATSPGTKINSVTVFSDQGTGNISNATLIIPTPAPPAITKTFGAPSIPLTATTSLTFAISNSNNGTALTGVGFSDTFPVGVVVATPNGLTSTCGGGATVTATSGSSNVSLSSAAIGANGSCTVSVNVTATSPGTKINSVTVFSDQGTGNISNATLIIPTPTPPAITKTFGAPSIPLSATTSLTFAISNSNNGTALTGVGFNDTFPVGLVVATPNGLVNSCGGGATVTATSGSSNVSLSSAAIGANGSCTVSVNVTGTTGGLKINSTTVISDQGTGNTTTASITVINPGAPTISNVFGAPSIPFNGSTSLSFTITNTNAVITNTGVTFTDSLPAGLVVATPNGLTGTCGGGAIAATAGGGSIALSAATLAASASCTFSVNVTGSTSGVKNNSVTVASDQGSGNTSNASVTVGSPLAPSIAKAFGAASIPLNGSTSLSFTITNPNSTTSNTGVGFTDSLPAGLVVATPNGISGTCGGGAIAATAGGGSIALSAATLAASTSCTFSVNVTALSIGGKNNAVTVNSDQGVGNTATASITVQNGSSTILVSSLNPSQVGQAVTFTATVTSGGGTPTGPVSFSDGGTLLGAVSLSGGIATLTTSVLLQGSHTIVASYAGSVSFAPSVSPGLVQSVNTPADSLKLRALQVLVTPLEAQVSGAAISGAINSAISEGFSADGAFVTPSGNGVRFNFTADPDAATPAGGALRSQDPFSSASGSLAQGMRTPTSSAPGAARVDDTFNALAYAGPTKAAPRMVEPREWLAWAEVRGAVLDHWNTSLTTPGTSVLYGNQINLLAGLTRKLTPNFLIGVLGGYETFDYRADALQGRLKGDGWTVGSYLGWRLNQEIRFDAGMAYSGIGYDGTAGTAAGTFSGQRWLLTSGLTGTYNALGLRIEPSARVYALWEHENAYTDTLGTLQGTRNFATGRASGGVQFSYPLGWSSGVSVVPYAGLYGDYYFNSDSAGAIAVAGIPAAIVLDGWSARATGGFVATFNNGGQITLGGERGGIGGNARIWTYRARASVPFGAQ